MYTLQYTASGVLVFDKKFEPAEIFKVLIILRWLSVHLFSSCVVSVYGGI
jgi:hypothetical protein